MVSLFTVVSILILDFVLFFYEFILSIQRSNLYRSNIYSISNIYDISNILFHNFLQFRAIVRHCALFQFISHYFAANLWFVVHFASVRIEGICTHEEMYFEYMYTKCGQDSRLDEAA